MVWPSLPSVLLILCMKVGMSKLLKCSSVNYSNIHLNKFLHFFFLSKQKGKVPVPVIWWIIYFHPGFFILCFYRLDTSTYAQQTQDMSCNLFLGHTGFFRLHITLWTMKRNPRQNDPDLQLQPLLWMRIRSDPELSVPDPAIMKDKINKNFRPLDSGLYGSTVVWNRKWYRYIVGTGKFFFLIEYRYKVFFIISKYA